MASRKESRSTSRPGSSAAGALGSPIKLVQIEGLVALKIIKHQEMQAGEEVQGVLLGLLVDDCLEITNCFPFPQPQENDEAFDPIQHQMEFMRSLRHVNVDNLHVGFYQSTQYGSYISRELVECQYNHQHDIEESVVLIYDPLKTAQGSLALKALRLTPKLMEIGLKELTPEGFKKANIGFEQMLEEVPIVFKNSHLINVLMWELEEKSLAAAKREAALGLSGADHMEKSLQLLMDRVDKYNAYNRNLSKQQQYLQRWQQENAQRQSRGEPPLPKEDFNKIFKPPQTLKPIDTLVIAGQTNTYCQSVKESASQNLGKLFMTEALQGHNSS